MILRVLIWHNPTSQISPTTILYQLATNPMIDGHEEYEAGLRKDVEDGEKKP